MPLQSMELHTKSGRLKQYERDTHQGGGEDGVSRRREARPNRSLQCLRALIRSEWVQVVVVGNGVPLRVDDE